jgi:hypothetical protein
MAGSFPHFLKQNGRGDCLLIAVLNLFKLQEVKISRGVLLMNDCSEAAIIIIISNLLKSQLDIHRLRNYYWHFGITYF